MAKLHVESDDLKILARRREIKVNERRKMLRMPKGAVVGLKTWGRIYFLTHHRGWTLIVVKKHRRGTVND